jgi:hypothetical protein
LERETEEGNNGRERETERERERQREKGSKGRETDRQSEREKDSKLIVKTKKLKNEESETDLNCQGRIERSRETLPDFF